MFTNELKKGDKIKLRNGWDAVIEDNLKGNTRLATVHGFVTEMGSVYSHDILGKYKDQDSAFCGELIPIEYTPAQLKCRDRAKAFGF